MDTQDDDNAQGRGDGGAAAGDGDTSSAAGPEAPRRRVIRRLPWYRQGRVWFWFVLASAAGAWVLAGWADARLYDFSTAPGSAEATTFCEVAIPARGQGLFTFVPPDRSLVAPETYVVSGRDAHTAVARAAPGEVAADAEALRVAFEGLGDEPTAQGWGEAVDANHVALDRLDRFSAELCGQPLVGLGLQPVPPTVGSTTPPG